MMSREVKGIYKNGVVELLERVDVKEGAQAIVTFVDGELTEDEEKTHLQKVVDRIDARRSQLPQMGDSAEIVRQWRDSGWNEPSTS
jgi:predicted DNA-binding antitoxin AbrB/MazE fold protein